MKKKCAGCDYEFSASDHHSFCHKCRAQERTCPDCSRTFRGISLRCSACKTVPNNERARDKRLGLTEGQYDTVFALQNGLCSICSRPEKAVSKTGRSYRLVGDHDHSCCPGEQTCGKCFRGLICRNCNVLLGMAEDNPLILKAALLYLERSPIDLGQPCGLFESAQTGHLQGVAALHPLEEERWQ